MPGLLVTKLHRPSIPTKWVQRQYLIQKLNDGLENNHRVTLVSAPAGFGKTTCVCEWVNGLVHWPVAWLSLDPADDDPGRFLTYLIAALQKVDPTLGKEIEGVIRSGQLPPSEIVSTVLINDVSNLEGRLMLILDDFHVIQDHLIYQIMEQVLANFPAPLHMVLITREDPPLPLTRLRASSLLTEVRAGDLRFTAQDAEQFLNDLMGLSLSQSDIVRLEEKTEGWIVGLQLAAIAMQSSPHIQDSEDSSDFITRLSGSHRFILSYLTEQVLNQQPGDIRRFLLQTSILDKLNGDLCAAVTGRSDSHALLEEFFNANLFLIPLDDEGQWYRYHHLFADLLGNHLKTLPKIQSTELHRLASRWYAREGLPSEAIQHALAAKDYPFSVYLLESHAMEMIMQGYAKTVNDWVKSLPEEWSSQSPKTRLAFAWALILRGAYSEVVKYLEQLQATWIEFPSNDGDRSIQAEYLVIQSLILYMQEEFNNCSELAIHALELAPEEDSRLRSLAYYVIASVYWHRGDYPLAVKNFQKSIQHARTAENLVAEMMSTASLSGMALEHGELNLAFEIASQAVDRIETSGILPPISALVYAELSDVLYHRYQLEDADRYIERALRLSILGGSNTITILCHVLLARLMQIEGNLGSAASEIQKAVERVPADAPEYVLQEIASQRVHIYLAQDRPAASRMVLQEQGFSFDGKVSFPEIPADEIIASSLGLLYNSGLRVLLYQSKARNAPNSLAKGIELADRLIGKSINSQKHLITMEGLLLRAQMHRALGNNSKSQADFLNVLQLAEPEGFISVFIEQGQLVAEALVDLVKQKQIANHQLDFVQHIQNAFPKSLQTHPDQSPATSQDGTRPMAPIEPLTEREFEVLHLISEGLKYKEIAARLYISHNTVRFHVKAIYAKLNVNNRTQAVRAARQLQIL